MFASIAAPTDAVTPSANQTIFPSDGLSWLEVRILDRILKSRL